MSRRAEAGLARLFPVPMPLAAGGIRWGIRASRTRRDAGTPWSDRSTPRRGPRSKPRSPRTLVAEGGQGVNKATRRAVFRLHLQVGAA